MQAWGQMSNPLMQGILAQKKIHTQNVTVSSVIDYDDVTSRYYVFINSSDVVLTSVGGSYKVRYTVSGTAYNQTISLQIESGGIASSYYYFQTNEIVTNVEVLSSSPSSYQSGNYIQYYTYN